MSNILPGQSPLAYSGVRAPTPPNVWIRDRAPLTSDFRNYVIGDEWWNKLTFQFWKLVDIQGPIATWNEFAGPTVGAIETINTIPPDGSGNFTVAAGNGITITPGTNSISIALTGSGNQAVETLSDDAGTLVNPTAGGNIQLEGHVVEQGATKFSTVVAGSNLLTINPMSSSRWLVDPLGFNGTHTTISAALASATSGDTIFLLPGIYTENPVLKSGVDLSAYVCDAQNGNVTINGECSFTGTGLVTLSGINLQTNGNFCLSVGGSGVSFVNLTNCYINCTNNTGISWTNSNSGSQLNFSYCQGDIGASNIAMYSSSSPGGLSFTHCYFTGSGTPTAVSTNSAGHVTIQHCDTEWGIETTGVGICTIQHSHMVSTSNTTVLVINGSVASAAQFSYFEGGTAPAITIGTGASLSLLGYNHVSSSNTNAISGSGTLQAGNISFLTSAGISVGSIQPVPAFNQGIGGTWTPTIQGAGTGGTTTYTSQHGTFTRFGDLCFIQFSVGWSGATGTGQIQLGGLPFPVSVFDPGSAFVPQIATLTLSAGSTQTSLQTSASSSHYSLSQYNPTTGVLSAVNVQTAGTISGSTVFQFDP